MEEETEILKARPNYSNYFTLFQKFLGESSQTQQSEQANSEQKYREECPFIRRSKSLFFPLTIAGINSKEMGQGRCRGSHILD